MNKAEILATYLAQHDALGTRKEAADKEEFDKQHRKIWGKCDEELNERMVKLEGQETLTPEEQRELEELRAILL